ncbi:MAG: polysaccharide biosynthesis/export family protein [Planctomycetota bacterium]
MITTTALDRISPIVLAVAIACGLSGCASWSNPVANGIPARLLPFELLAESKEGMERIPLSLLRQKPPKIYRLGPGDMLGLYIDGVTGKEGELPPVNFPRDVNIPPSVGYPLPIRDDGTLPLPLVEPVKVEGMSLTEAQETITKVYTEKSKVLLPGESPILVTLIRPRHTRVLVIREDAAESRTAVQSRRTGFGTTEVFNTTRKGTGDIVELPAYQDDVLTALARTGGLPGTDATDAVLIQRGYVEDARSLDNDTLNRMAENLEGEDELKDRTTRIPLRTPHGQPPDFRPEDIILEEGDIVYVKAREGETFYTAGLLPSAQIPLPRDYDVTVVEAIALAGGPILNGGFSARSLSSRSIVAPGIGNPSPSLVSILRHTPNGGQVTIRVDLNQALKDPRENLLVQGEDVLILQETPGEAFARYLNDIFRFDIISDVISRADTSGTTQLALPD